MSPHAGDAPRLRQYTPGIIAGLVFSLGYFLSYFSRTINAVLTPYFQNELQIGVDDLGLLTASYYLSFALLQLPIGALMDRYGPRIVNVGLFSLAVLGALVFYAADNLTGLVIGRALIGAGVAGALMCGFKILRMWVPINLVPSANGIYLLVGSAGAAFAGTPTSLLVESLESWRQVFLIFAGVTVVVMGLMWVLGKENDRDKHLSTASLGQQAKEMGIIFTRFSFWSLVPLFAVAQAISLSVSTLWSHRYLEKVA
ncbi:MAG: MFS transporter, partial [Alphaproteobacteria bacterium]|nr:MFS transporter [Alphaproteobacteria bacterium]